MNITLTGATGFVGQILVRKLLDQGHSLHILARKRKAEFPETVKFSKWDSSSGEPPEESLENADAVIHLAGEPVAQRWNADVKRRIRSSRVDGTRALVQALSTMSRRPSVLIAASAVGYYGDRADQILTEKSPPGHGFLAELCVEWEKAAELGESLGIRVLRIRIGIVLGADGGALKQMVPPFKLGLGGRLGSGKQWMSWIHREDLVNLILFALDRVDVSGAINGTATNPVTNAEFTQELSYVLHRPALLPVPLFGMKMLYGEMAELMFESARVIPAAAKTSGFEFQYPSLAPALKDLLG